jgi:hypothetical protein
LDLEALALEKRALVRRRGVPDAKALLRLALARGPGGMSLRRTAAWAQLSGVADLTDASLDDRLHQSCDVLAAIGERDAHRRATRLRGVVQFEREMEQRNVDDRRLAGPVGEATQSGQPFSTTSRSSRCCHR